MATIECKSATLAELLSASDADIAAALAKVAREIMRRRRVHWRRDERLGVKPTFKLMSVAALLAEPLPSRRQSRLLGLVEKGNDPVLSVAVARATPSAIPRPSGWRRSSRAIRSMAIADRCATLPLNWRCTGICRLRAQGIQPRRLPE